MDKDNKLYKQEKAIAKAVISAQFCSDAGKGVDNGDRSANYFGYNRKVINVLNAIKMIENARHTEWRFYVTWHDEYSCYLTYFEYLGHQISFHNPNAEGVLKKYADKGKKIVWDHKSSRDTAYWLKERFNL